MIYKLKWFNCKCFSYNSPYIINYWLIAASCGRHWLGFRTLAKCICLVYNLIYNYYWHLQIYHKCCLINERFNYNLQLLSCITLPEHKEREKTKLREREMDRQSDQFKAYLWSPSKYQMLLPLIINMHRYIFISRYNYWNRLDWSTSRPFRLLVKQTSPALNTN